jgi:hypothetical protein
VVATGLAGLNRGLEPVDIIQVSDRLSALSADSEHGISPGGIPVYLIENERAVLRRIEVGDVRLK